MPHTSALYLHYARGIPAEFLLRILLITAEYISQQTSVHSSFEAETLKISCVIHTVGEEVEATTRLSVLWLMS
jgi:hypothetical protein